MKVILERAALSDVEAIAALRVAAAAKLTKDFGKGPWSSAGTIKGVLYSMRHSNVFVCRRRGKIVGVLELGIKKPWAIDKSYFSASNRPLYLTGMAVIPEQQRSGIGRAMLEAAVKLARAWPADAIRLDAYDAAAGAGEFYARCGFCERGRISYRNAPLIYYELLLSNGSVDSRLAALKGQKRQ
jgi:ribosomal protein S18 acetylase RimI-like enzyme